MQVAARSGLPVGSGEGRGGRVAARVPWGCGLRATNFGDTGIAASAIFGVAIGFHDAEQNGFGQSAPKEADKTICGAKIVSDQILRR